MFPVNIVLVQFQQTHYGVRTHSVNQFTLSPENYRADGRERERENETERMRERMRERERERYVGIELFNKFHLHRKRAPPPRCLTAGVRCVCVCMCVCVCVCVRRYVGGESAPRTPCREHRQRACKAHSHENKGNRRDGNTVPKET